jgi:hypothetical protein
MLLELVNEVADDVALVEEISRLASIRISISAPAGAVDISVVVRERRARIAVVGDRGIECVDTPYIFNSVRLYTDGDKLRAEYIYTSKHIHDVLPISVNIETVGDLFSLVCNLSEEDVSKMIEAVARDRDTKIKMLEQLKQVVALVRMALGAEESEESEQTTSIV